MAAFNREEITKSLQTFKKRRDAVLHDDVADLEHNLQRLMSFCETDAFIQSVVAPLLQNSSIRSDEWWKEFWDNTYSRTDRWDFPDNADDEFALRYQILKDISDDKDNRRLTGMALSLHLRNADDGKQRVVSVLVRPLCEELTEKLSAAANIPSTEVRALQAVPPNRIPGAKETKIFLSHRTPDKPLVMRYYNVLNELGFQPWLDTSEMPVGTALDRGIVQGFNESCAVIFFITENFKDERYIADEINYAKIQKRDKGERFAIITLCFSDDVTVPDLLKPYVFYRVWNELEGLHEILRALPVELGAVLWKEKVI